MTIINTEKNTTAGFFIDNRNFFIVEIENNKELGNIPINFKKGKLPLNIYSANTKINIINAVNFFKKIREDIGAKNIVFQDLKNTENQKELIKASKIAGFETQLVRDWKDNIESLLVSWSEDNKKLAVVFFHNENFKELISLYIIDSNKIKNTINYSGDIEENIFKIKEDLKKEKIRKISFSGDFVNAERIKELFFALKIKSDILNIWQNFFSTDTFIPNIFFEESHIFMKAYSLALPEEKLSSIFDFIYDKNGFLERQRIIKQYDDKFSNQIVFVDKKGLHSKKEKTIQDVKSIKITEKLTSEIKKVNSNLIQNLKTKKSSPSPAVDIKTTSKKTPEKLNLTEKIKKSFKKENSEKIVKENPSTNLEESKDKKEVKKVVENKKVKKNTDLKNSKKNKNDVKIVEIKNTNIDTDLKNIIPVSKKVFTADLKNKEKIFFNFFKNNNLKSIKNIDTKKDTVLKTKNISTKNTEKNILIKSKTSKTETKNKITEIKNKKVDIIDDVKNFKPTARLLKKSSPILDIDDNDNEKRFKNSLKKYFIETENIDKKISKKSATADKTFNLEERILELKKHSQEIKGINKDKNNVPEIEKEKALILKSDSINEIDLLSSKKPSHARQWKDKKKDFNKNLLPTRNNVLLGNDIFSEKKEEIFSKKNNDDKDSQLLENNILSKEHSLPEPSFIDPETNPLMRTLPNEVVKDDILKDLSELIPDIVSSQEVEKKAQQKVTINKVLESKKSLEETKIKKDNIINKKVTKNKVVKNILQPKKKVLIDEQARAFLREKISENLKQKEMNKLTEQNSKTKNNEDVAVKKILKYKVKNTASIKKDRLNIKEKKQSIWNNLTLKKKIKNDSRFDFSVKGKNILVANTEREKEAFANSISKDVYPVSMNIKKIKIDKNKGWLKKDIEKKEKKKKEEKTSIFSKIKKIF